MRRLTDLLWQESPILLAREVVWRTRKNLGRKRLLAQIDEEPCPVSFRNIPYYKPDPSAFGEESRALITGFADEICEGRFPFLGYGTVDFDRRPKWNVDFISGLDWPQEPLENRACVRFDGSDVKVPWELSRLQFLPILGKAHVLTGDERYRETAKDLLSNWIDENPVGIGVNWCVAMEAALRGLSICFLLNLLSPLRPQEHAWLAKVTRSLWQHLVYIEAHSEFSHLLRSNHYLSNVVGLYGLSSFLEGEEITAKRRLYRRRVEDEILHQVYEDGGDYEASTGYHVFVTQMFTSALLVMRAYHTTPNSHFLKKLRRMHAFIAQLASSSGELPHFGDCDDGRVELLLDDLKQMLLLSVPERNSLRVSQLVGLGKCLFDDDDGATDDAKWYGFTGNKRTSPATAAQTVSSSPTVTVFPQSGIAVAKSRHADLLFFAVPNGICGKGAHTHNDKLSFILRLGGEEVLCDSGSSTYTRDALARNRFRVTAAHNTVLVDDREQNTIIAGRSGLFRLGTEAEVTRIEQGEDERGVFFRASHTGYRSQGVTHIRTTRLPESGSNIAVIEDALEGSGRHCFEINFQLAPKLNVASLANGKSEIRCTIAGPQGFKIVFTAPGEVNADSCNSLVSMTYGSTTPSTRLRFSGEADLPTVLTTRLCWAD
jgi:hypothetical protein